MNPNEKLTARMRTLGGLYAECLADAEKTGLAIREDKLPFLRIKDFRDWDDVQERTVSTAEDAGRWANRAMDLREILQGMTAIRREMTPGPDRPEPERTVGTVPVHVLRRTGSGKEWERLEQGGHDTFDVPVLESEDTERPDCSGIVLDILEGFVLRPGDTIKVEPADPAHTGAHAEENGR